MFGWSQGSRQLRLQAGKGMDADPKPNLGKWIRSRTGLALLGFLGVIAFFLLTEHTAHAFGVLPYLLLLLCPLLHLFMHGRHGDHSEHSPQGAPMDRQEEQSSGEDE